MAAVIQRVDELVPSSLAPLVAKGVAEGWGFVRKLADDWQSGVNRFDQPGECLFIALVNGSVVGVCGLNVDPYTSQDAVGRIRRLYVLPDHRRAGVGRHLVEAVVAAAVDRFHRLRVRTENPDAGRLYEQLGFLPSTGDPHCTHVLNLTTES